MWQTHLGEPTPDRTSLLWSQVKGRVLLLLVELPKVLPCLLVHDRQHTSNGFADRVANPTPDREHNPLAKAKLPRRTSW